MTTVAQTILEQLGGNMFRAMTGAKDFVTDGSHLRFKIGRGATNAINLVTVKLEADDTYTVTFARFRALKVTPVKTVPGVYCDMLRSVFTEATGFDCTMGRIVRGAA